MASRFAGDYLSGHEYEMLSGKNAPEENKERETCFADR
jgi:hypothetical protein